MHKYQLDRKPQLQLTAVNHPASAFTLGELALKASMLISCSSDEGYLFGPPPKHYEATPLQKGVASSYSLSYRKKGYPDVSLFGHQFICAAGVCASGK